MTPTASVMYRQLGADEWERLRHIYEEQGVPLPPADSNLAVIAEANGEVVGLCGINMVIHMGPLWVDPAWRGQGVSDGIAAEADRMIRSMGASGYLMFPSNKGSAGVAERLALEPTGCQVFQRKF